MEDRSEVKLKARPRTETREVHIEGPKIVKKELGLGVHISYGEDGFDFLGSTNFRAKKVEGEDFVAEDLQFYAMIESVPNQIRSISSFLREAADSLDNQLKLIVKE